MLTCRDLSEIATDYLEGDLGLRQRTAIQLHLLMCKHCRRYVDQLAKTVALLRASAQSEAPGDDLLDAFRKSTPARGRPDA